MVSVTCQARRNLQAFRWPSSISKQERRKAEDVIVAALGALEGDLSGEYFPLAGSASRAEKPRGMSAEDAKALDEASMLMRPPEAALVLASGAGRDWPDGRGVFARDRGAGSVAAWVHEEDHLCLWSRRSGADAFGALRVLTEADIAIRVALKEAGYEYAFSDAFGFLTSCPSNLGTALRITFCLRVPHLVKDKKWKKHCGQLGLSVAGFSGHGAEDEIDVSCAPQLARSEVDQALWALDGVRALLDAEAKLESGEASDAAEAVGAAVAELAASRNAS